MKRHHALLRALAIAATAFALIAGTSVSASAYAPTPQVLYQLPSSENCLKGRGNCVVYPKSAQLASGRIVAAFEKSTVVPYAAPDTVGGAKGQTLPVWKSDDSGTTWQPLSSVAPPATLSSDPNVAKYTSNWTNPYLYVLPQTVGNLAAGTLLLASVVSGEDEFYREKKAADPNWVPSNDGDRRNVSIALYSSTDSGVSWKFINIIAAGGWQGGSAGAGGVNVAAANSTRQVDPVWEPHLIVINNQLVAYYSDENDYIGYNTTTGAPTLDPNNATAADSGAQILVHRTWNGVSTSWSTPVVDVAGQTFAWNGGQQIGGGRPGMTTVAPTTDGKWLMTFEYFGGGDNVHYKTATDPLRFFADVTDGGSNIGALPATAGSRTLSTGGSPVLVPLPDGRIIYNAAGSGNIWVSDGTSTGAWTEFQTTLGGGYSRNLQYDATTGRVVVLQATWGGPTTQPVIRHADVDLGRSAGAYYQIVNRKTGQVIGTGNRSNDANIGNGNAPDVRLEAPGAAANPRTQQWHLTAKSGSTVTLLNGSGGRAASIWTGNATAGQGIGQWVDDTTTGQWNVVQSAGGYVRFQSTANTGLYLTGATAGASLSLQASEADGSQEWQLVAPPAGFERLTNRHSGLVLDVYGSSTANGGTVDQWAWNGGANQQWQFQDAGAGFFRIVSKNSGMCLDVNASSTADGGVVQQWACGSGLNQQWRTEDAGSGYLRIVNRASSKCLDINAYSTANGGVAQQWTCGAGANQQWKRTVL